MALQSPVLRSSSLRRRDRLHGRCAVARHFRWQLQPFCNVVTVNVTQQGAVYTVDGYDDQCGAAAAGAAGRPGHTEPRRPIGFGLNVVTVPGGRSVHIDARISLAGLGGPWTDSEGNSGTFAFGAATGGSPRPAPATGGGGGTTIPPAFALLPDGGFLAGGTLGSRHYSRVRSRHAHDVVPQKRARTAWGASAAFSGTTPTSATAAWRWASTRWPAGATARLWGPSPPPAEATARRWAPPHSPTGATAPRWVPRRRPADKSARRWVTARWPAVTTRRRWAPIQSPPELQHGLRQHQQGHGKWQSVAGTDSVAGGVDSIALGLRVNANGIGSVVIGSDATATTAGTFMYGDRSTSTTSRPSDRTNSWCGQPAGRCSIAMPP